MSAFSIAVVESALRAWLMASTGLNEDVIRWADQSGGQPTTDFIIMRMGVFDALSIHDDVRWRTQGGQPERFSTGPRVLGVYVQANTRLTFGASSAFELARKAQRGLGLPSVRVALAEAGLALQDAGRPRNIATLLDTRFQGRYAFDVLFNTSDELITSDGFIEAVSGTGTVDEDSFPFSAP